LKGTLCQYFVKKRVVELRIITCS